MKEFEIYDGGKEYRDKPHLLTRKECIVCNREFNAPTVEALI